MCCTRIFIRNPQKRSVEPKCLSLISGMRVTPVERDLGDIVHEKMRKLFDDKHETGFDIE